MPLEPKATDVIAIQDLVASYAEHYDRFESEKWARTFTPEGVFVRALPGVSSVGGYEDLVAFADKSFALIKTVAHLMSTSRIFNITDTSASGYAYCHAMGTFKNGGRFALVARYDDDYAHTEDGWKFVRRTETQILEPELEGFDPEH
jgi:hypothetical protein